MKTITEIEELLNDENLSTYEEMVVNYLEKLNNTGNTVTYKKLAAAFLLSESKKKNKEAGAKNKKSTDTIRFKAKPDTTYQRFFITLGNKDGVNKLDIVDFIKSKVTGISTDDFADVYILDAYSFFELEATKKDEVIANVDNTSYKGHEVHIEFSEMRKPGNKNKFVKRGDSKFYKS